MDNTLCTTYTIIIPVPVLELNQLLKAVNGSDQINLFESFFFWGGGGGLQITLLEEVL